MTSKKNVPTVFVRGLPFDYADDALVALFSQAAPVKHAFIVRDPAKKTSKGYGFVQFALEEDAATAAEKMNNTEISGRKISVELAKSDKADKPAKKDKKPRPAVAAEAAPTAVAGRKRPRDASNTAEVPAVPSKKARDAKTDTAAESGDEESSEDEATHTGLTVLPFAPFGNHLEQQQKRLAIFGLPQEYASKRVWKRVKKCTGAQGLHWPFIMIGNQSLPTAIVEFKTKHNRDAALKKLDKHVLQGHTLHVRAGEHVLMGKQAQQRCRLIVRNVVFNAVAADVKTAFLRNGSSALITHVNVPESTKHAPEEGKPALNRGFAFVEFATHEDAALSLAAMNAKKILKREVAVDWSVPQQDYKAAAAATVPHQDDTAGAAAAVGDGDGVGVGAAGKEEKAAAGAGKVDEDGDDEKEKENENDENEDENDKNEESDVGSESGSDDGAASDDDDADNDVDAEDSEADADDDLDSDDDDAEAEEDDIDTASDDGDADASKGKADDLDVGTTVFVRNLPFDATDASLFETMRRFGPVRYARVVMDKETGRSKGTAFVQYYHKNSAAAALAAGVESELFNSAEKELDPRERKRKLAEAAIKATLSSKSIINGKVKYDRRHLYLQYEGAVSSDSVPSGDAKKRETAAKDKKQKLQSPLFFVSPTRLSVRNLAKHVDDKALKNLAKEAAVAGMKAGLVKADEGDPTLRLPAGTFKPIRVLKAKVIRESLPTTVRETKDTRIHTQDGTNLMSKGYGFVEFQQHFHALAALRQLNNNPAYSAEFAAGGAAARKKPVAEKPRLIVEFTIENWKEVKKQEMKKQQRAVRREANEAGGAGVATNDVETRTVTSKITKTTAQTRKTGPPTADKKKQTTSATTAASTKAAPRKASSATTATSGVKRQRDDGDALDRIAAAAFTTERTKERRPAKKREQQEEAHHDKLVNEYMQKFFGDSKKADSSMGKWM